MAGMAAVFILGAAIGAAAVRLRRRRLDGKREALFAFAAHELASPATGMRLTVRNFMTGVFGELSAEHRKWMSLLEDHIEGLAGMSGDLGDLAHLEFGNRLRLRPRPFDFARRFEQETARLKGPAERWGVSLRVRVASDLPRVHGDPDRVARVAVNLVAHALKFSIKAGEVEVSAEPASSAGGVRLETAFQPVDDGPPEALLERFDVARGGKTLKISGIGLTVAEEIIRRTGGTLRAERDRDRVRFVLVLPGAK